MAAMEASHSRLDPMPPFSRNTAARCRAPRAATVLATPTHGASIIPKRAASVANALLRLSETDTNASEPVSSTVLTKAIRPPDDRTLRRRFGDLGFG